MNTQNGFSIVTVSAQSFGGAGGAALVPHKSIRTLDISAEALKSHADQIAKARELDPLFDSAMMVDELNHPTK